MITESFLSFLMVNPRGSFSFFSNDIVLNLVEPSIESSIVKSVKNYKFKGN